MTEEERKQLLKDKEKALKTTSEETKKKLRKMGIKNV